MDKKLQEASAKLTYKSGYGFLSANVTMPSGLNREAKPLEAVQSAI